MGHDHVITHLPIYRAALHDDWDSVSELFDHDPDLMTRPISLWDETPLLIAIGTNRSHRFTEKLVKRIIDINARDKLFATNSGGTTPLHYAAMAGNTTAARLLVEMDPNLTRAPAPNHGNINPVNLAALHGNKETLKYLLTVTEDLPLGEGGSSHYTGVDGGNLISLTIISGFLDVALEIIHLHPRIVFEEDWTGRTALDILAQKPGCFPSGNKLGFWGQFIYSLIPVKKSDRHDEESTIFSRSFDKEVEKSVETSYKEAENNEKKTPRMVFTEEHKELLKEGQQWMKDTASSCTVVAALIVTMAFAAAFTLPGGNKDDGKPMFLSYNTFMLFIVSDAVALFSSSTSVLMFLSILTSRYAEEDFLYALPKRLTIGLLSLFMSIAATMIAFSSALALVLQDKVTWVAAPLVIATSIPVCLFGLLQFPLLVELVKSTYGRSIFHQQNDRLIH